MRCSLCEKNECAGGVVCPACEAHYASLREGQVRRQNLQVGEHALAHLAWSAVAVSPGKGKARDEAGGRFSFFRRRKAESAPVEAEEAPPPPDWKNRVRPAPDGLPPLHEAEGGSEPASEPAAAGGALTQLADPALAPPPVAHGPSQEAALSEAATATPALPAKDLAPPTPPTPLETTGPLATNEAPSVDPAQAPPPALASFFESLGGEVSPPPPLPTATEPAPTPDAADLMSGFLAALAAPVAEANGAPPQALPAETPSGSWPLEQPAGAAPEAPDALALSQPPSLPEAPVSVESVDPSVFQSAELPALDWSLDPASPPSADGEAPVVLDWAPESQAAPGPSPLTWPEGQADTWTAPDAAAPVLEAPALEAPALEAPAQEAPVVDGPILQAPTVEAEPLPEAPATAEGPAGQEVVAAPSPDLALAFDFLAGLREAPEAAAVDSIAPPLTDQAPARPTPEAPAPAPEAAPLPSLGGANFFEGLAASAQVREATSPDEAPSGSPSAAPAPSPSLPPSAFGDFFASLDAPAPPHHSPSEAASVANDPLAGFFADLQGGDGPPAPSAAPQDPGSISWKLDQAFAAMASPAQPPSPEAFPQAPLASQFQREALPQAPPREGGGKPGGAPFTIDLGAGAHAPTPKPPPPPPSRPRPQDPSDGAFSFVREDDEEGVLDLGSSGGLLDGLRFQPESQSGGFSFTPKPNEDDDDEGRTIEL